MKNQHILRRFHYAWSGLKASWQSEKSFRAHVAVFIFTLGLLIVMRPSAVWCALLLFACGLIMAVELINTAVEKLIDHLHPDQHKTIGIVKDALSGAVFVSCVASGLVLIAFIWTMYGK